MVDDDADGLMHRVGAHSPRCLHRTAEGEVYRARLVDGDRPVIVKRLRVSEPTAIDVARFALESEVLRRLHGRQAVGAPVVLQDSQGAHGYFRVTEDLGGETLRQMGEQRHFGVEGALALARRIGTVLEAVHRAGVTHGRLRPEHIVCHAVEPEVQIIGFGTASMLIREPQRSNSLDSLQAPLVYLAPEQMGCLVGRWIDKRCDVY
ncbi:MAG TPA: lipopolysaccharide kinase InaA family protein, partial [Myxococcota bacterium]|nr:lipopolysaccharide kinase InaA family protein [Myxococcota bacterium]